MTKPTKNWAELHPLEPPPEVLDWLRGKGELLANLLIYRCDWMLDPLANKKRNMVKVKCTACGEEWYEKKSHVRFAQGTVVILSDITITPPMRRYITSSPPYARGVELRARRGTSLI